MKNNLDDVDADASAQAPPQKRIKLEQDPADDAHLLSSSISAPPGAVHRKKGGKKAGKVPKSTLEGRALVLLQDTRISAVEPQQVMCRMCGHWVKLFKHTDFSPANWRTHAEKCEMRTGWKARIRKEPGSIFTLTIPPFNPPSATPPPASITAPARVAISNSHVKKLVSPGAPAAPRRSVKSTAERKNALEADMRAEVKEPHRVFCAMCRAWVKLHNTREYDLWNWQRHAEKCELKFRLPFRASATPVLVLPPAESLTVEPVVREPQVVTAEMVESPVVDTLHVQMFDNDVGESREVDTGDTAGDQSLLASVAPQIKSEPDDSELLYPASLEEGEMEEGGPVSAPNSFKRRKARSLGERRQSLMADPRTGEVRPHEVFCRVCGKWIKLYKEIAYVESNWVRHAERCSVRHNASATAYVASEDFMTEASISSVLRPVIPTPLAVIGATSASAAGGATKGKRGPVKTVEERLQELQSDTRIASIQPNQVLCGICNQWIKLQVYREYDSWNWRKHIPLCEQRYSAQQGTLHLHPSVKIEENEARPSMSISAPQAPAVTPHLTAPPKFSASVKVKDESTSEERREELIRDGRCERIEPHRVVCKVCSRQVGLHAKKDYSLTNWYKHILSCSKKVAKPVKALKTPLTALGILRAAPAKVASPALLTPSTPASPGPPGIDLTVPMESVENKYIESKLDASSVYSNAQLRNAEERRVKLLADQRIGALEPNRAQCKLCQRWLKLSNDMEYAPYNWYKHIERCEVKTTMRGQGTPTSPIIVKEEALVGTPEVQLLDALSASISWNSRKRHTSAERLARMQADARIKTIEKHRAQCGLCEKWVKLQNKTEYDPHNWMAHIKKCEIRAKLSPASRLARARSQAFSAPAHERVDSPTWDDSDSASCSLAVGAISSGARQALLVNDVRTAEVEPYRVLCAICLQWIKLRDGKEYIPHNWFKHKSKCERKHGLPRTQIAGVQQQDPSIPSVKQEEPVAIDLGPALGPRKKTDEEREAGLRADSRLAGVEPGRVFCRMCNNWIRLNTATGYLPSNWLRHAQRCQRKTNWQGGLPSVNAEPPELRPVEVIDLEVDSTGGGVFGYIELGHLVSAFEPSISSTDFGAPLEVPEIAKVQKEMPTWTLRGRTRTPPPPYYSEPKFSEDGRRMHRTESSRKEELQNDPRTNIVLPDKILCGMCGRWIQMRRDVSYSSQNWLKHAGICEVRSGWLQSVKTRSPIKGALPITQHKGEVDGPLPYNARVHMDVDEDTSGCFVPKFKPVNWEQDVIFTDDDEDEMISPNVPTDAELIPSSLTPVPDNASTPVPENISTSVTVKEEELVAASTDLLSDGWKASATPTPLTLLRATKAKHSKPDASLSDAKSRPRKQSSKSSTSPAPFTTAPLVRSAPTPPVPIPNGAPAQPARAPTPLSLLFKPRPQTGINGNPPPGAVMPRPIIPFVIPIASSMLPHLLPKPLASFGYPRMLPSPFLVPATPPVPSNLPAYAPPASPSLPTPPASALSVNPLVPKSVPNKDSSPCSPTSVTTPTAAQEPASEPGPTSPQIPTSITSVPEFKSTVSQPKATKATSPQSFFAMPPHNIGYGLVRPGVLQLAPTPTTTTRTAPAPPNTVLPAVHFDVPDAEQTMDVDVDRGMGEPTPAQI